MREQLRAQARADRGVLPASAFTHQPSRTATAAGLVVVQPRVYVAGTQPLDGLVQLEAVRQSVRIRWAVLGRGALWLYGAGPAPEAEQVVVGVPHSTRLRLEPPVQVSRVSLDVLARTRQRRGHPVVDLEMAVLQSSAKRPHTEVVALLEPLLRERRTTVVRLRERRRRGRDGSANVGRALDELVGGSLDRAVRVLKQALEQRGVTGLECEVRFISDAGAACYGDLWSAATQTLVELDGFLSHAVRARFRADRRRDRWMRAQRGITTLRVDVGEVWESLDALADELAPMLMPPADHETGRAG